MTEPDISPLAKRLAEENNVNWRVLSGSGAGGKVVERDVLEYLARVMAGEEAMNPTPEPLPEGMEAWPDEDVHGFGSGASPDGPEPEPLGTAATAPNEGAPASDDPFEAAGTAGSGFGGDFDDEFDDDDLLELDDDPPPAGAAVAPPAPDPFGDPGARFGGLAADELEGDDRDDVGGAEADGVGEISEDIFLFDDGGADDEPAVAASAPGTVGAGAPVADDVDDPFAPEGDDLFAEDLGNTGEWMAAESSPDVDDPFDFEPDTGDGIPVAGEDEGEEAIFLAPSHPAPAEPEAAAGASDGPDFGFDDEGEDDAGVAAASSDPVELAWGATEDDDEAELAAFGDDDLFAPEAGAGAEPAEDLEEALFAPAGEFELEEEERAPLGSASPAPVAAAPAADTTADVPLVTYGTLLRRHVDLDALAKAQAAVARELGESEPLAPSAFLLRAAAKALRAAPLGAGPIAVATVEEGGLRVRTAPDATDGGFLGLVEWLRREEASADGRADGAALVVADLSDLGIDEAVLNLGAPVLTLGRVLYDTDGGGYRSTLSLSGEVPPETGSRLLARVAELIAAPVQLVL